jgi:thiamine biosynthesis lipoprotein
MTALVRRARPALGTLVEIGARGPELAVLAAFEALNHVERALSAFDPASDIGRFNDAGPGFVPASADTLAVLSMAAELSDETSGLFDVTQGTGPRDWAVSGFGLRKLTASVRIDLGGIGKGYAVDRAFEALGAAQAWVNAGGDLRAAGFDLPVALRDELGGGVRSWMVLRDGALATSWFGPGARSRLHGGVRARHVSVAAPSCMVSDALTKVVALSGRVDDPILARYGATAWVHA